MPALQPDWDSIRRKVDHQPWARAVLTALEADFCWWRTAQQIPAADRLSHRFHTYFCNEDGAKLTFDFHRPTEHVCPKCGKVYSGQPWDGAWVMQMHNAAAGQAERAAVLMRVASGETVATARTVLNELALYYAWHYRDYAVHGDRAAKGRVQPHGLNEAVWIVTLLRAIRWSGIVADWQPQDREALRGMARLTVELLQPQIDAIHNHDGWKLAALAECAAVLDDAELRRWCRESKFGMDAHLRQGYNADGFWFESSITYHFYMLDAVFSYQEAMGAEAFSDPRSVEVLSRAIRNPARLAYRDGRMPAYADGWIATTLDSFAPVAEVAFSRLPEVDLAPYYVGEKPQLLRLVSGGAGPEFPGSRVAHRASVAALVYGPEAVGQPRADHGSFALKDAGISVLRNERVRLGIRFGADGGWHDHRDKLNVDVETASGWRSLDLGTSGYDSGFTHWLRSPVAHNVIIVGGRPQEPHTGALVDFAPDRVTASAGYEGVRLRRALQLTATGWSDRYEVTLDAEDRVEWVFHGDGLFQPEGKLTVVDWNEKEGYSWLREVKQLEPVSVLRGRWEQDGRAVQLSVPLPSGFSVFIAHAPGNADDCPMGVVLVRGRARQARFEAEFAVG